MSLLCLSTWCQGGNVASAGHCSPLADHDSHEQRRANVLPGGRSKLLHSTAADSSQSCRPAIAHLSLLPGVLHMLRSGLHQASMLRMVHAEGS